MFQSSVAKELLVSLGHFRNGYYPGCNGTPCSLKEQTLVHLDINRPASVTEHPRDFWHWDLPPFCPSAVALLRRSIPLSTLGTHEAHLFNPSSLDLRTSP